MNAGATAVLTAWQGFAILRLMLSVTLSISRRAMLSTSLVPMETLASSPGPKGTPESVRELTLRFAAFLLRVVEDFPPSSRPLGEAINAQVISLVDALVTAEERTQALLFRVRNPGSESPHTSFTLPQLTRILYPLEIYLEVARDAGHLSPVLHHLASDVITELRERTEALLNWAERHALSAKTRPPEPLTIVTGPEDKIQHEEQVPHKEGPHVSLPLKDRDAAILMLLKEKNPRRFKEIKPYFPVTGRALRKDLARLVAQNKLIRRGQPPQSWYELP